MAKHSLKIISRFALVLMVIVPSVLAVAFAGFHGLQAGRDSASRLYHDELTNTQHASNLAVRLEDAQRDILLLLLLADNPTDKQRITTEFLSKVGPDIETGIATLRTDEANDPANLAATEAIAVAWVKSQQLFATGAINDPNSTARAAAASQITAIYDAAAASAKALVHNEGLQAAEAYRQSVTRYRASVRLMTIVLILGLMAAMGIVIWLIRSVLTRTLAYSAFASEVTQGDYTKRLSPRGGDELAQLGRTLDNLAGRRQAEDAYEHTQGEFADALQQTETENEAQELLKRHLELTSPATITILNRNNSADRLEAVTAIPADSPLVAGLEDAKPRSCLAVRLARPYLHRNGDIELMSCPVCSGCPSRVTCTPLLVGGEVIGSVLANHPDTLAEHERRSIREAVTQAAPVLGNLRNLAIVEMRAATDTLTGLPNRRALQDTLRRMVAQSARTATPLAALMCDVDHFKRVNDRFGHGRGDDVLAALGSAVTATLRASDFASRFGGEEFLILLPATDPDGAFVMAEKIRSAVADIKVPTVDQGITLSVGIAVMPNHAIDAESLQRYADRALYAAKNAGRDRTEVFTTRAEPHHQQEPAPQPNGTHSNS